MKKRHIIQSRRGFTLVELLIVIAIIAVLVAIAIPLVNTQLEKSREAYDIATMRQAASAAVDLYYAGITDSASAAEAGLSWSNAGGKERNNAYGAYDPNTSKIYPSRSSLPKSSTTYGRGTALDGGTSFVLGNENGAYKADEDYTKAVVMVSIYPNASRPYVVVYWKNNSGNTNYVGGQEVTNVPRYSIKIYID